MNGSEKKLKLENLNQKPTTKFKSKQKRDQANNTSENSQQGGGQKGNQVFHYEMLPTGAQCCVEEVTLSQNPMSQQATLARDASAASSRRSAASGPRSSIRDFILNWDKSQHPGLTIEALNGCEVDTTSLLDHSERLKVGNLAVSLLGGLKIFRLLRCGGKSVGHFLDPRMLLTGLHCLRMATKC